MAQSTRYPSRGGGYPSDRLETQSAHIDIERIPPEFVEPYDGAEDEAGQRHDGPDHGASTTNLLRELVAETANLVRTEAQVFKLEAQKSAREMAGDAVKIGVFAGLAVGGLLCLLAFAVVGLGALLAGPTGGITGYWLSALILGVLFAGLGGGMAYYFVNKLKNASRLDQTKEELERDRRFLKQESQMIREAVRP